MRSRKIAVALAVIVSGLAAMARAQDMDVIYFKSGEVLDRQLECIILNVKDDLLLYQAKSGTPGEKPMAIVNRIQARGENAFNEAEKTYFEAMTSKDPAIAKRKYADSVTGYQTSLNSSKAWVKAVAGLRLTKVAPLSGRIDLAITSWVARVRANDAEALKARPSLSAVDPKSALLPQTIKRLEDALRSSVGGEQRRAYRSMIVDIYNHMGDQANAGKVLADMVRDGGTEEEKAALEVNEAQQEFAKKDFKAAGTRLAKLNIHLLADLNKAQALFILAECNAAKLSDSSNPNDIKDVIIDYVRSIAAAPQSPRVAATRIKLGELHEKLKEIETAQRIYTEITSDYPGTPEAAAAQKAIERLKSAPKPG